MATERINIGENFMAGLPVQAAVVKFVDGVAFDTSRVLAGHKLRWRKLDNCFVLEEFCRGKWREVPCLVEK